MWNQRGRLKIAIGSDHAGFRAKELLAARLRRKKHQVWDAGTTGEDSVDYPDFAKAVAGRVARGAARRGILVCGTGIGMSISANKVKGVRAALCNDLYLARMARSHNDANVLSLGGRVVGTGLAEEIVSLFLATPFEGGRHARRVEQISEVETQESTRTSS